MHKLNILETTLRDGSYAINFRFTANDTAIIASHLENAGFEWIEIGHGVGMHASESGYGKAIEKDESYLKSVARVIKRAKWGMFCIPGIARLHDIDLAAHYGMKFIRIGTNVTEVEESRPFIELAKKHGMYVFSNFMKSYVLKPADFAEKALLSQKYGTDVVYIVDSAGSMMPEEMESYFNAVHDVSDIPLGFHGHNNLGMSVSNSLKAAELGALFIDTSLQGLGRSAGNTPTEIFLMVLKRKGIRSSVKCALNVMDIGEEYIKPLIRSCGLNSLDIVSGYAQFHSSYMGTIHRFASKYNVDPRKLIIRVCDIDKVNASSALVESIAQQIKVESKEMVTSRFHFDKYFGNEQSNDNDIK